jgi:hypothetical protein
VWFGIGPFQAIIRSASIFGFCGGDEENAEKVDFSAFFMWHT